MYENDYYPELNEAVPAVVDTHTDPSLLKNRSKGRRLLSMLLCGLLFGAAAAGAFKATIPS